MLKNQERNTIQKLEELSLYLEIKKYQTLLATLKNEVLSNVNDETVIKQKELELRNNLNISLESIIRFGIDPTNEYNLRDWMMACSIYIKNLDMIEHTIFLYQRNEASNLGLFGTSEYKESTILKNK